MLNILITIFNQPSYSSICLNSLSIIKIPFNTILVNNGSRLKTSTILSSWVSEHENAKLVTLPVNKGFAAGINAGVNAIEDLKDDDLVLILHNDCQLFEGAVEEMVEVMQKADDDTAVVSPLTNYANEMSVCLPDIRKQFEAIKPPNKERLMLEEIVKIIDTVIPDRSAFLSELKKAANFRMSYIPEIASFCMLTKGYFLKDHPFNEEFWPRGYEDKFWFRKHERSGFVCMLANRAFVWHHGNLSSDGPGMDFTSIMTINRERFDQFCIEEDRKMAETLREKNTTETEALPKESKEQPLKSET